MLHFEEKLKRYSESARRVASNHKYAMAFQENFGLFLTANPAQNYTVPYIVNATNE